MLRNQSGLFHCCCQLLYYRVKVFPIRLPLFEALLSIALELLILIFKSWFSLLGLIKLFSIVFLFLRHFLWHLPLQIFSVFIINILSVFLLVLLFLFEIGKFVLPCLFEFFILLSLSFLFSLAPLYLVLQRLLILALQYFLFLSLFALYLLLLLFKLLNLATKSFSLIVLDLAQFKWLLFVKFFSLLYLLID